MTKRVPTSPRKKPRQERAQATVDAIVDATAHILVHEGYDALSTNRVAERAGVSIGSLYQYFPNKEALVGELVDRHSSMIFDLVYSTLVRAKDAPAERAIEAIVRAMVETKARNPRLAKVLREQIPRTGRLARYEREMAKIIDVATAFMDQHRDRLAASDARLAAFVAVHTIDAVTHASVTQPGPHDVQAMADETIAAVSRYLLRDPKSLSGE